MTQFLIKKKKKVMAHNLVKRMTESYLSIFKIPIVSLNVHQVFGELSTVAYFWFYSIKVSEDEIMQ